MPDPSAGEVGGIFAGVVALLIALGKALGWLLSWKDRREETRAAKLERWHQELVAREEKIERQQADYQTRIESQLERLAREHAALRGGYQLIAGALRILDPDSPALRQADELLKSAFPLEPLVPGDMHHLAAQIHRTGEDE